MFSPTITTSFAGPLSVMGAVAIAAAIAMAVAFFSAQNNRRRSSDYGYARSYDLNRYSNFNNYWDVAAANKVVPFIESWTEEYGR